MNVILIIVRRKMEKILDELFANADKKYQEFHSGLCPNIDNIIGVRIPRLREIAKRIARENPEEFLSNLDDRYYETIMLYGMVIGYMKTDLNIRQKYLDVFVPKIDNWAICDCCTSTYKFTKKHLNEMFEYIQKYLNSDKEFEIRFGVVMLMDYYLTDEYIEKVFQILGNIKHEGYYVKMGIAWAISMAFIKYEKQTREFLKSSNLDNFTYNKSLQKIIESNRVQKEIKEEIRKMKRKYEERKF